MERITERVNGKDFDFYCSSRNTRNGFAHDCELWADGRKIAGETCHYLNRTWEAWQYQTVCLQAVDAIRDEAAEKIRAQLVNENGWKRITQQRAEIVRAAYDANDTMKLCDVLRARLNGRRYGSEEERERLEALDALVALAELIVKHPA